MSDKYEIFAVRKSTAKKLKVWQKMFGTPNMSDTLENLMILANSNLNNLSKK